VSVVFGLILAVYYNWMMAILVIAIFPLGGVGHALHIKFFQNRSKEDTKELEIAGNIAIESKIYLMKTFIALLKSFLAMKNIRTIQALTLEERFYKKFCDHLALPLQTHKYRATFQAVSYGFASSIFYFLHAAAFAFGVYLILNYETQPMSVMRTLFAISFTAGSMGYASAYFPEYAKARFAAGIIFKMLSYKPQIDNINASGRKLVIL
jgi:ATP-binding cassette subfamily B (MDR/TAP) protein 1